jgi:hypothetical protein
MTEAEWASCQSPQQMLVFLRNTGKATERRCRLFACACVRRIWPMLAGEDWGNVIAVAEEFADGNEVVGR